MIDFLRCAFMWIGALVTAGALFLWLFWLFAQWFARKRVDRAKSA